MIKYILSSFNNYCGVRECRFAAPDCNEVNVSRKLCLLRDNYSNNRVRVDRNSTVVKVLCYKSEGRCFDPSWCNWSFR